MAHEPSHHYAWLNQVQEEILEPDRRICDAHHHLWDTPRGRYLLDELMFDLNTGHRVVSTVFVECMAMYRAEGPAQFACPFFPLDCFHYLLHSRWTRIYCVEDVCTSVGIEQML